MTTSNPEFDKALALILQFEGGYSNIPSDPGKATNFGITQATYSAYLEGIGSPDKDVKGITQEEVTTIYRTKYWAEADCGNYKYPLSNFVFDCAVNSGVGTSRKYMAKIQSLAPEQQLALCMLALRFIQLKRLSDTPKYSKFAKGWFNRLEKLFRASGI